MAGQMDAGGRGGVLRRGLVAEAKAAILPDVRRLIEESIGRIAVRTNGNLAALGIRSALMFDPAATVVVDDPDHEQVIVPLGGGAGAFVGAAAVLTSNQNVADGFALNEIAWDATAYDTSSFWSAGAPKRLTVPIAGYYLFIAQFNFTTSVAGDYGAVVQRSGVGGGTVSTSEIAFGEHQFGANGNFHATAQASLISQCVAGDFFIAEVSQKTGGTMTLDKTATFFQVALLGV
jgi:hypothetical protein